VIAFLTNVNEHVGDAGRYIHVGMTSSDVLDTGLALQLKASVALLRQGVGGLRRRDCQAGRRTQSHRDDRPFSRDPWRTDHLWLQAGWLASGNSSQS
jgi:hypothetical protein